MPNAICLYSGGADSCLAAVIALTRYEHEKILLFTFNHKALFIGRSRKLAGRLKKRFGQHAVTHSIMRIDRIFNALVTGIPLRIYLRYPLLIIFASRMAMYTYTARYALEHGIKDIYDGSTSLEGALVFPQSPLALSWIKEFFNALGLNFSSPVYNCHVPAETILIQLGIMKAQEAYQAEHHGIKKPAVGRARNVQVKKIIHSFANGIQPVYGSELWVTIINMFRHKRRRRQNRGEVTVYLQIYFRRARRYIDKHTRNNHAL